MKILAVMVVILGLRAIILHALGVQVYSPPEVDRIWVGSLQANRLLWNFHTIPGLGLRV